MGLTIGSSLVNLRAFIHERHGAFALARFLEELPEPHRSTFASATTDEWYDEATHILANRTYSKLHGGGDPEALYDAGIFSAQNDFTTVYRWIPDIVDVSYAVLDIDRVWRRAHDTGQWTSTVTGDRIIAKLSGWDVVDEASCCRLKGYIRGALESGGRVLEIAHPRCRARRDRECEFHVRWHLVKKTPPRGKPLSEEDIPSIDLFLRDARDLGELARSSVLVVCRGLDHPWAELWVRSGDGKYARKALDGDRDGQGRSEYVLTCENRIVGKLVVGVARSAPAHRTSLLKLLLVPFANALERAVGESTSGGDDLNACVERAARALNLEPRAKQVLELVLDGLSNPQIAARLGIKTVTVEKHMRALFIKTGLRGVPGLKRSKLISLILSKFGE